LKSGCTGTDLPGWPSFNIWWFSQIPQARWDAALEDDTGPCLSISTLARRSKVVGSWGRQAAKIWITQRGMSFALFSWDSYKKVLNCVLRSYLYLMYLVNPVLLSMVWQVSNLEMAIQFSLWWMLDGHYPQFWKETICTGSCNKQVSPSELGSQGFVSVFWFFS
jgi:hypothetical protein